MADILNDDSNNISNTPTPNENPVPNPVVPVSDDYVIKEPPPHGLDSSWRRWKCLVCGYVYEGLSSGKMVCPRCGNSDPDKFDEAE